MENIITMTQEEGSILLLHMAAMRDAIKKGLKRNYGILESRKLVKQYDEIKDMIGEELTENEMVHREIRLTLNIQQHELLNSFLTFYTEALRSNAIKENIDVESNETYSIINGIKSRIEGVVH